MRFNDLADKQTGRVLQECFVKDVVSRGHDASWGDAAFRAFESPPFSGSLSKFSYCLAWVSLLVQESELTKRPAWINARRQVVFNFYDSYQQGTLDLKQFESFLEDVSKKDEPLKFFGLSISHEALSDRESTHFSPGSSNTTQEVAQSLALTKVQLTEKIQEIQELELNYVRLEKKMCQLKLELAEERAKKDHSFT